MKRIGRTRTTTHDFYRMPGAAEGSVAERIRAATPGIRGALEDD